jgi:DNA repair protein RadC
MQEDNLFNEATAPPEMVKVHFKKLEWKFKDSGISYDKVKGIHEKVTSPETLYNMFKSYFAELPNEHFMIIFLSSSNKVIGFDVISQGTLNASLVHPREVFRGAITANCANIVLAHNHPSGNPEPSNEDILITKKLIECGKILEINVFDHIIFSGSTYTSFIEKRII